MPAVRDGMARAGAAGLIGDGDVGMGFYGDLFRPGATLLAVADPPDTAVDVGEGFELAKINYRADDDGASGFVSPVTVPGGRTCYRATEYPILHAILSMAARLLADGGHHD